MQLVIRYLNKAKLIDPAELGLLASIGIGAVTVHRKLRVAFFSTGDELRPVGAVLEKGQVYDSNRYTIYGMLSRLGVEINDMGVINDDKNTVEQAFLEAADHADVIVTSGGVSVGEADFVKETLGKIGTVSFWKVAMKTRPTTGIWKNQGYMVFLAFLENPVSVMVTFYMFVQPALKKNDGRQTSRAFIHFSGMLFQIAQANRTCGVSKGDFDSVKEHQHLRLSLRGIENRPTRFRNLAFHV